MATSESEWITIQRESRLSLSHNSEGMPISKSKSGEKGDLIVSFVVEFPENELTEEQKEHVRAALPKQK